MNERPTTLISLELFDALKSERDQWKSAAETQSRKYLEARGAWQIASDDRARLETERDALRERAEATELRLQRIDEGSEEAQREADEIMRESLIFKAERDALRVQLEKAKAALKLIHITDDGPSGDCAGRALKEMDDAE